MSPRSRTTYLFFFFNDTATTEIYTLPYTTLFRSLYQGVRQERLSPARWVELSSGAPARLFGLAHRKGRLADRKSTRLNSSHDQISYAVFCLKKKKKTETAQAAEPCAQTALRSPSC